MVSLEATAGSHRVSLEATGGHWVSSEATVGHRVSLEATGASWCHWRLLEATGSHYLEATRGHWVLVETTGGHWVSHWRLLGAMWDSLGPHGVIGGYWVSWRLLEATWNCWRRLEATGLHCRLLGLLETTQWILEATQYHWT
jgi:hypothetical protein